MTSTRTWLLVGLLLLLIFLTVHFPPQRLQGQQIQELRQQIHTPPIKIYPLPGPDLRQVLSPGVYILKLPEQGDGEAVPVGSMKQGFYHEGSRADTIQAAPCGGNISQLLNDEGNIGYRCERCGKKWSFSGTE